MGDFFEKLFHDEFHGHPAKLIALEEDLRTYFERLTEALTKVEARKRLDDEAKCNRHRVNSPCYLKLTELVGDRLADAERAKRGEIGHFITPPKRFWRHFGLK